MSFPIKHGEPRRLVILKHRSPGGRSMSSSPGAGVGHACGGWCWDECAMKCYTAWWFGTFFYVSPIVGMMIQSDELHHFSGGLKPPISIYIYILIYRYHKFNTCVFGNGDHIFVGRHSGSATGSWLSLDSCDSIPKGAVVWSSSSYCPDTSWQERTYDSMI